MKKLLYVFVTLLLCISVGSCGLIGEPAPANDSDSLSLDSLVVEELEFTTRHISYADSVEANGIMMHYSVDLDVPVTGAHQLVTSVNRWLGEVLGGTYGDTPEFDTDADALLRRYSMAYFDDKTELTSTDDGFRPAFSYTLSATLAEETDGFVPMACP